MVFHTELPLIKEFIHIKRIVGMRNAHGIQWSYHFPHQHEAAALIEWWSVF
jgi:hypothetical protein